MGEPVVTCAVHMRGSVTDGLLTATPTGQLVLTPYGRLPTDAIVRDLLPR